MANKERILLTGGSGFIGKNLLESPLALKYEVLAPRRAELDLMDEAAVAAYLGKNDISCVIHSACRPAHRNAPGCGALYANTRMFFNLASNSNRFGKMIVIGSGAAYDSRHYQPKMREEYFGAHVPEDEHGFSRYVCGRYIEKAGNIIDLRVFGIFGKHEDYSIRFISNMICKALFDLPLTMKQNRKFDYIWVNDLPPILEYFITHDAAHKAYNVTPDSSVELLELARRVLAAAGKELPVKAALPGLGPEYSGDNSRLKGEIKNLSFTPPDKAIEGLWAWYSSVKGGLNSGLLRSDK